MPYKDPKKAREAWRRHYHANHEDQRAKIKARRSRYDERNQDHIWQWLLDHPCIDCGESDPAVLEFDHLGDKEYGIAQMLCDGTSLQRLRREIAKCEVVCRNCHQRRTSRRNQDWRYLRGGRSSMVEFQDVTLAVAGSIPVAHPS